MPDPKPQSYATHVHRPRAWTAAWLASVLAFVLLAWHAATAPSLASLALVLLAVAVVCGITLLRVFAIRLQDRIIRLEMQGRLARLGRADVFARASLRQLIALRFASDAELPALADRAIAEHWSADQIKRAVTDWQADDLRT